MIKAAPKATRGIVQISTTGNVFSALTAVAKTK